MSNNLRELQKRWDAGEQCLELVEGDYYLDEPIHVGEGRPGGLTIVGKGRFATTITAPYGLIDSDGVTVQARHLSVEPPGRPVDPVTAIILKGGGAHIDLQDVEFQRMDGVDALWLGGMISARNAHFKDCPRFGVKGQSTTGFWVPRILGSYFDGREADGLIQLRGTVAGGLIQSNYMQASRCHLHIASGPATDPGQGPVNELLIQANLFDQDSAAEVGIRLVPANVGGQSSNSISIRKNYIASTGMGIYGQNVENLTIDGNEFRALGRDSHIHLASARRTAISGANIFRADMGPAHPSAILLDGKIESLSINGATSWDSQRLVGILGTLVDDLRITGNAPAIGCGRLAQILGNLPFDWNGNMVIKGNSAANQPYQQATGDGNILRIPIADQDEVIGVGPETQTFNRIIGPTCRQGVRLTLISASPVRFDTGADVDGAVGSPFVLEPLKPKTLVKFSDNRWYAL